MSSPSFNFKPPIRPGQPVFDALSGDGHPRGTRTLDDFASFTALDLLRRKVIAMVPNWVRTEVALDASGKLTEIGAEHETFGKIARSFQTWTDTPPFQWHHFYDWNFHVIPEPGLDWLRGKGNAETKVTEPEDIGIKRAVVAGKTMELEWDVGAFGTRPGPMFNEPNVSGGQKSQDLVWPMTGDHLWAVGRSIYDGGHPDDAGLSRSELHPLKAIATARREAFQFPGTPAFVPATQFMFFTSKLGGYKDFATLAPRDGKDYEFLVDLPLRPDDHYVAVTHPVGATPDFPFNRLALREIEPLVFFDFTRHQVAAGKKLSLNDLQQFKPIVTFERPKDEQDPRKLQARIKIPLLAMLKAKGSSIDSYGVVISLGWPDVNGAEAKKVKRCRVNLTSLHPVQDQGSDIWRFKIGVNGRWFHWEEANIFPETDRRNKDVNLTPSGTIQFFLPEDGAIRVNFHGAALRAVDDAYTGRGIHFDGTDLDRTVMVNGAQVAIEQAGEGSLDVLFPNMSKDPTAQQIILAILGSVAALPALLLDVVDTLAGFFGVGSTDIILALGSHPADWDKDIDVQPPHAAPGAHPVQNVIARNVAAMLDHTLGVENNPLPLIDPNLGSPSEQKLNPLPVKGRNDTAPVSIKLRGLVPAEVGKSAELVEAIPTESPRAIDLGVVLNYTVQVDDQIPAQSKA